MKICLLTAYLLRATAKEPAVTIDRIEVFPARYPMTGFFKFSTDIAEKLVQQAEAYIRAGKIDEPYEELIRDLLLQYPDRFNYEDITNYPWLEIDFPEDVIRAEQEILPKIASDF